VPESSAFRSAVRSWPLKEIEMEASEGAATAAAEEARLVRDLTLTREGGEWRTEVDAASELLLFYMDAGLVLGIDEVAPKFERLAGEMRDLIGSVLGSDDAPQDEGERKELERTLLAIDAGVQSFHSLVASEQVKAATAAAVRAAAEGDFAKAGEAAALLQATSRDLVDSTEGPTEGWPEDLRATREALRDRATESIATGTELQGLATEGQTSELHPSQVAARLKLVQAQREVDEAKRRVEVIRRDLHRGSLRRRAVNLVALALALAGERMLERAARSYERTASRPPKSAVMFERARTNRGAATVSLEASERHRQASHAALDAPTASPAVASVVQFVFGWAVLGVLLTANYVVFALFDSNYFRWYLDNGALISLVFGFVSLAVHLDDYPDLVSSNPMRYLYACWTLNFHFFLAWNQLIAVDVEQAKGVMLSKLFDTLVSFVAMLGVTIAFIGWLLVVAPIQHIAYAVLGAPARNALRNPAAPRYDPATDSTIPLAAGSTETGHAFGYVDKPVALTSALTATVLWIGSQFVW
jgi:hypothetical protein